MDQNNQVVKAHMQLGAAQHRLSLNYDVDQLKTHINCKVDEQPPILLSVALYSVSR